jgi:hypothetical protein
MLKIAHRFNRLSGLSLDRLCRNLLLPLLLLIAQHGALLHELSHYAPADTQDESGKQQSAGQPCELCLGFAQVESTATADVAVPTLLAGLSFASASPTPSPVVVAELPAQRNRGPPATL